MTLVTTQDKNSGKWGSEVQGSNPEFTGNLILPFFSLNLFIAFMKGYLQGHVSWLKAMSENIS